MITFFSTIVNSTARYQLGVMNAQKFLCM